MAKAIGTLGNVDSVTIGGFTFVDITNLKMMVASTATTGNVCTFRQGGSTGYQVTTGKTLTLKAYKAEASSVTAAAGSLFFLFYADNDVGMDTTTARTNQVNYMNGTPGYNFARWSVLANTVEGLIYFPVAALKYPGVGHQLAQNVAINILVAGYEA